MYTKKVARANAFAKTIANVCERFEKSVRTRAYGRIRSAVCAAASMRMAHPPRGCEISMPSRPNKLIWRRIRHDGVELPWRDSAPAPAKRSRASGSSKLRRGRIEMRQLAVTDQLKRARSIGVDRMADEIRSDRPAAAQRGHARITITNSWPPHRPTVSYGGAELAIRRATSREPRRVVAFQNRPCLRAAGGDDFLSPPFQECREHATRPMPARVFCRNISGPGPSGLRQPRLSPSALATAPARVVAAGARRDSCLRFYLSVT